MSLGLSDPVAVLEGGRIGIYEAPGHNLEILSELGYRWSILRGRWEHPGSLWAWEAAKDALGHMKADTTVLSLSDVPQADPATRHPCWEDLFDFQRDAVRRLIGTYDAGYGQILAMSPGLGKTATSIVAADVVLGPEDTAIVVCPASLVPTWEREITRWSHASADLWWVMSYEAFVRDRHLVGEVQRPLLILDESIMIKSHNSKRTGVAHDAMIASPKNTRGAPPRFVGVTWCLSGSPIARYPDDLWAQLRMCRPAAFSSYWRFAERYCQVKESDWGPGKVVIGPRRKYDARAENADLMHVVNQEDVLKLPEYIFSPIDVELTKDQTRSYEEMLTTFETELADKTPMTAENKGARLIRLQQIVSGVPDGAKHDALLDLVRDGLVEMPLLVWTHWKHAAIPLVERLSAHGSVGHVDGDTPDDKRDHLLRSFEEARIDILVLSLGVGKFGHTFKETKTVAYVDRTFAADDYVQSLRRVRRIGLEHRPVIHTLRAPGTVDDLVEKNLEGKLGSISRMTDANLLELLRGIGKEV